MSAEDKANEVAELVKLPIDEILRLVELGRACEKVAQQTLAAARRATLMAERQAKLTERLRRAERALAQMVRARRLEAEAISYAATMVHAPGRKQNEKRVKVKVPDWNPPQPAPETCEACGGSGICTMPNGARLICGPCWDKRPL